MPTSYQEEASSSGPASHLIILKWHAPSDEASFQKHKDLSEMFSLLLKGSQTKGSPLMSQYVR